MKALVWSSVILLTALSVASCSKKGGGPTGPSGTSNFTISINGSNPNFTFTPDPADAGGKSVVFKNNTSVAHRVRLNDLSIDTGDIAPGATSSAFIMPTSGTNYHCPIHTMGGSIEAQGGGAPPPCTDIYCY